MKKVRIVLGILCLITMIGWGSYLYTGQKNLDLEPPVLQAQADILTVSIEADESELMKGVSALDERDGDISNTILIENIVKKEDGEWNEFLITYVAFDSANNAGHLTRTLVYEDYRLPHFILQKPLRFPENQKLALLNYFKAEDCLEGDISTFITLLDNSDILNDLPRAGFYEITLSVTNSLGDTAELPVQIEIYENNYEEQMYRPQILLTEYITYVKQGAEFEQKHYLDYIQDKSKMLIDFSNSVSNSSEKVNVSDISSESDVNTDIPGVYSVIYTYTSKKTGYSCNARLIVVVE